MKFLFLFQVLLLGPKLTAAIPILIADTGPQPPYTLIQENQGLSSEVTQLLNQVQDKYIFSFQQISVLRIRKLLQDGSLDIIAFDNPQWSWEPFNLDASDPVVVNDDVFFTLKSNYDANYRKKLGHEPFGAVENYHYHFNNNNTDFGKFDPKFMTIVKNEQSVFEMVLLGRLKLGIISNAFLNYMRMSRNTDYEKIHVYPDADQEYFRYFLLSKTSKLKIGELNHFLKLISKQLISLLEQYGSAELYAPLRVNQKK